MAITQHNARAGPSRARQQETEVIDDDEDEQLVKPKLPEEGWTIPTFKNQPVVKTEATLSAISSMIQKMKETRGRIAEGMAMAQEAACHMEEASPDDEMIGQFEAIFQSGIDKRAIIAIKIEALEKLNVKLRHNQAVEDIESMYMRDSKDNERVYVQKSARAKYKDNEEYQAFRAAIWEVNHQGEACPPVSAWLPREDGDVTDEDEDIEMGGQTQNYRCPITMLPFVDPVTSTDCKHSYSKAAVMAILSLPTQGKKRAVKCPLPGCGSIITKDKLREDPVLQRRTDEAQKRAQRREAEQEEEDEDEY